MAYNWTGLQSKVHKRLLKYGAQGSITYSSTTPNDTNKPWKGNGTGTTSTELIGITLPLTSKDIQTHELAEVRKEMAKLLVSPLKTDLSGLTQPDVGDEILLSGKQWKVASAKVVSPAGTPVIYEVIGSR